MLLAVIPIWTVDKKFVESSNKLIAVLALLCPSCSYFKSLYFLDEIIANSAIVKIPLMMINIIIIIISMISVIISIPL